MEEYKCVFCNKICKSNNGLSYHQNRCKLNPNKKIEHRKKYNNKFIQCPICKRNIKEFLL